MPLFGHTYNMLTNLIVTAYCACKICCGSNAHGITASGMRPVPGVTCAASRSFPFGTKVRIAGHEYIVQDRLAKRYDSRVDIYYATHAEAKKAGIRTMRVEFVK
jgi:3D (Asp-Asp-Asp) domain-containing protein